METKKKIINTKKIFDKKSFSQNSFTTKPFAEIIESSCSKFLAQTWDPQGEALLGGLVEVSTKNTNTFGTNKFGTNIFGTNIFGIITSIQTGSQDPMRYPFTYKKTEEELKREQPQIFEFLKTTFDVQIVGTTKTTDNVINYNLPLTPPKIHSFVRNSDAQTIKKFFSKTDFLSLLFSAQISNLDEILLIILKSLKLNKTGLNKTSLNKNDKNEFCLNKFCRDFALLSGNDYKRLKLFLKRVQQI